MNDLFKAFLFSKMFGRRGGGFGGFPPQDFFRDGPFGFGFVPPHNFKKCACRECVEREEDHRRQQERKAKREKVVKIKLFFLE